MSDEWGQRGEDLAVGIIGPLVLGGPMQLQRPFGASLALKIGAGRGITDNDLRSRVDTMRLRVARSLVAVDVVTPMSAIAWALCCGFNDLLQITNHELSSFATRGRHSDLIASMSELNAKVPPCATLDDAVSRHATVSRALEVQRTDINVSWWTGSDSFRGQDPPPRLLAWPGLRNVRVQRTPITVADMAAGVPIRGDDFLDVLSGWLACSPLSDIATADRVSPPFMWSTHTVSLVSTIAGSNLALRALSHATNDDPQAADAAVKAMKASAQVLPEGAAKNIAGQFAEWLEKAKAHWAETG